jgi:hypothetical protein
LYGFLRMAQRHGLCITLSCTPSVEPKYFKKFNL